MGAILSVALALRVALFFFVELRPGRFDFPDSHRYLRVARNIAAGLGAIESPDRRASTDPLYPAVLSLGIRLGCESDAAVFRFARIVNALAALVTILLLWALGRRTVGDGPALFAAAVFAVDPILLFFNALVLTETVYIFLLVAALACWSRSTGAGGGWWTLATGAALGLGALTRSTALLLPVVLIPAMAVFANSARLVDSGNPALDATSRQTPPASLAANLAILILGFVLVIAPWTVRNHRVVGHFVPVRVGMGASLLEALGPWADGGPGMERIKYPDLPPTAGEYERDRRYRAAAVEWIRRNPARAVELAFIKLGRTWSPWLHAPGYRGGPYQVIAVVSVVPVYLLALVGLWVMRRQPARWLWLLAPAAYYSAVHMVFVGSVRYRLPAMPLLFLCAGAGLRRLTRRRPS